jgi:hypothetical protein
MEPIFLEDHYFAETHPTRRISQLGPHDEESRPHTARFLGHMCHARFPLIDHFASSFDSKDAPWPKIIYKYDPPSEIAKRWQKKHERDLQIMRIGGDAAGDAHGCPFDLLRCHDEEGVAHF